MKHEKIKVEGMTCASCQAHVSKAISELTGVNNVNVNLLRGTAEFDYDDNLCSVDSVISAINHAGYKASSKNSKPEVNKNDKDYSLLKLISCIVILLILMYFSMGNMMWGWPSFPVFDMHKNPMGFSLLQFILVLPIVYIYRNYYISGYKKLFMRSPNMDTLIAIGSSISILYGIYCLFMISVGKTEYHNYLYFESAGMILVFVSIGKYLEGLSKRKTTESLTKLMDLAPKKAVVIENNTEVEKDIEDVKVDDIVVVKKGEIIPVDGVIIDGKASINEANLTGESVPVYKDLDKKVFSSTIVENGYIKVKAVSVGEDTTYANIIKLVDEASNSKAPISKLADKVSLVFVPTILIISLITFIVNFIYVSFNNSLNINAFETALNFAITVIVIACPCALGLATPVAIMVGMGTAANCGLLIKNAEILENTSHVKYAVMDKTGTITLGKPKVVNYKKIIDKDLLPIIYAIEKMSEHPLASAVVEYTKKYDNNLIVDDFEAIPGSGLKGVIDGKTYLIGNKKLLNDNNIEIINYDSRNTLLYVVENNTIASIIEIDDEIKKSSIEAIKLLKERKIHTVMLTGDNSTVANKVQEIIGVDEVISDVLPADKAKVIEEYKKKSDGLVVMIGDGVNDSIALAKADLGIAIGGGSDVAIETSDIVLLRNDLIDVVNAIDLSKKTVKTIKFGLFWAFFYNVVCVILATGIFYYLSNGAFKMEPMYGSIAMSLSSVSVVLNALTINLFKARGNKKENKEEFKMQQIVISVDGMMCKHCKAHVEEACKKVSGVADAVASLEEKNVTVTLAADVKKEELVNAIVEAGYEAK